MSRSLHRRPLRQRLERKNEILTQTARPWAAQAVARRPIANLPARVGRTAPLGVEPTAAADRTRMVAPHRSALAAGGTGKHGNRPKVVCVKKAVLYLRVSTIDQNPENQFHDLRQLAAQRGFEIVREYVDHGVSGARVKRPAVQFTVDEHKFVLHQSGHNCRLLHRVKERDIRLAVLPPGQFLAKIIR